MNYTLENIAAFTGGKRSLEFDGEMIVNNVLSDSRKVEGEGNLFVALRGDRFDGHNYVDSITASGKNCAIIEDEKFLTRNTVFVPDVRKALYDIAMLRRKNELNSIKCVAVTGSVGKTSTKEYVNGVFSSKYKVYKSPGNMNSYTGLPMVILNAPNDSNYMILELGMNTAGEISTLSKLAKPDIGIITNIGWSHSEYLGGRENIRKEKLDITVGMNGGILIVNGDDDMLDGNIDRGCDVVRCSLEDKKADFYCSNINEHDGKIFFTVNGKEAFIRQIGVHNVKNAMLAYAAGITAGVSHDEAVEGLSAISENEGRIKVRGGKNGSFVIDDCYNAAPESMKAALDYLKTRSGRRIAVLGDMLELGDTAPLLHENVGKHAGSCCDVLLCYGELGKYIAKGAKEAGHKNVFHFSADERELFIKEIDKYAENDTYILFKASNRMRFGEVISSINI